MDSDLDVSFLLADIFGDTSILCWFFFGGRSF